MILLSKKKIKINKEHNREILGITFISFGMLSVISLFSDKTGIIGMLLKKIFILLLWALEDMYSLLLL